MAVEISDELRKKVRIANRRIREMRNYYTKGHSSLNYVEKSLSMAYGEKRQYYSLSNVKNKAQLKRIEKGVEALLNSPYSTKRGRTKLYNERIRHFQLEKGLSRTEAERLIDIFESDIWSKIHDEYARESSQVVANISLILSKRKGDRKKITSDDLEKILNYYMREEKDKSIIDFLKDISEKERVDMNVYSQK